MVPFFVVIGAPISSMEALAASLLLIGYSIVGPVSFSVERRHRFRRTLGTQLNVVLNRVPKRAITQPRLLRSTRAPVLAADRRS